VAFLRGGGAALRLLLAGRHGYTCLSRSHLTRHESGGTEVASLEDAMNRGTAIQPTASLAPRAEQPRLGPRTNLRGGVVLMLAWIVLEGAFLFEVARPQRGARNLKSSATTQAVVLARSSPSP